MATGIVKFFKAEKGWRFIKPEESEDDVFVHIRDIPGQQPLQQGMRVGYDRHQDERTGRTKAVNVRIL